MNLEKSVLMEHWSNPNYSVVKENIMPIAVKDSCDVECVQELLNEKDACVAFRTEHVASFTKKGAYVVLDFGKELCGGLRFITRLAAGGMARFRITFGESLSETYTELWEKNATNDHSPRDFIVNISNMSDLTWGMTGFRFARIELLTEQVVRIRNIFAVNTLPLFQREAVIETSDKELNDIIKTAAYTLKLNLQSGYIWDGIKRDRLVWSGDLNQEILTSIYLFGDNQNVTNSLSFLRKSTPVAEWINTVPIYSAWWIVNLCDYCRLTGNTQYFEENKEYAITILSHFNDCIDEDGNMDFHLKTGEMGFYLDWPTYETPDAIIGTAALIIYAAKMFNRLEENEQCNFIVRKLARYLDKPCEFKQTRAFQILAGREVTGQDIFLEKNGAEGFSTFMSYYILTADAKAGGKEMLSIIKEYYGAMLSRGATTFWEEFSMDWLIGSGRIDELPKHGEKDIHGDYGAHCYKGFRRSLCHGWAAGVLAFVVEYMLGLSLSDGGKTYNISPHPMGVKEMHARIPVKDGWIVIEIADEKHTVDFVQ